MSTRSYISKSLATTVANKVDGVTVDKAQEVCETLIAHIINELKHGDQVTLTNFIKFKRVTKGERTYTHPKTGDKTIKPAHLAVTVNTMPGLKKMFEELDLNDSPVSKDETSSDDDEEEIPKKKPAAPKKKPAAAPKKKPAAPKKKEENDDDVWF